MKKRIVRQKQNTPQILLIGLGRFGKHHLRVLQELECQGQIKLKGVFLRSGKKRKEFIKEFDLPVFSSLTAALLKRVDAVDIVTPLETHYALVGKCLRHTNVFVEKPLATKKNEALKLENRARKFGRILSVGHIFRYHPVTEKLKELLREKKMPGKITGTFINPSVADQGRDAPMELLHLFDIVDFLWNEYPIVVHRRNEGRVSVVDLRYTNTDAHFVLGWKGSEKERKLKIIYPTFQIEADFIANTVSVTRGNNTKYYQCPIAEEPLKKELVAFIGALSDPRQKHIDGPIGTRIVDVAERAGINHKTPPTVAVIGGGIFGTSMASELGKFCNVTLIERKSEIMQEGSRINQFRHHYGYHYPRSDETVVDIHRSIKDFEQKFKKAILYPPTYYGLARKNSLVTVPEFLEFCKKHQLAYKKKFPSSNLLSRDEMALCIQVPEPSYHYERLKKIVKKNLNKAKIKILLDTTVVGCEFGKDDKKIIRYKTKNNKEKEQSFDFVVNATYASINNLTNWLGFKHFPLRIDLAEVLIVKLPIPPISITVIDGPFATLMPTGNKNEFTLYHVKESIIDRYVHRKGLMKKVGSIRSRQAGILKESMQFFPILKQAVIVESRIVHRGVRAFREHDDARVADLIDHGFGCWSILSGKILSSVTTGKKLAAILKMTLQK